MERKKIKIKLIGGDYFFSERNKKDIDFASLQEKMRIKRFEFIQQNVKEQDALIALMMSEIEKVYSAQQISMFLLNDKEIQLKLVYDSFKIENNTIDFNAFKKLIAEDELEKIMRLIDELENETAEKKSAGLKHFINENKKLTIEEFTELLSTSELQRFAEIVYLKKKNTETEQ